MGRKNQAVSIAEPGPAEGLKLIEVELPELAPGQVLVETRSVGVNFIEIYQRSGVYPVDFPFIPGGEAAGVVLSVGPDAQGFTPGDRVVTSAASAAYATAWIADAAALVKIPDEVSFDVAASIALQGNTAHYLANSIVSLGSGSSALVHAGAGGVGGILIQLLKLKGVTVYATASTQGKRDQCIELGADSALPYEGFSAKVRELTSGQGVNAVFDGVGRSTFDDSLKSLARRGMMALYGGSSGQVPPFDAQILNRLGSLFLTRPSLGDYMATSEERDARYAELFNLITAGDLNVRIAATFPLAEAGAAQEALASRKYTGKILLHP